MFSKGKILGVALATLVAVGITACGGGGSDGAGLDKKVKDLLASCNYGNGKEESCKKVVEIYESECNKKNAEACNRLGQEYSGEMETITGYDAIKAVSFFSRACDLNYGEGCANLAWKYREKGEHADKVQASKILEKAIQLYEKECESGNIESCRAVGEKYATGYTLYDEGQGEFFDRENKDYKKGLTLLQKFCDKAQKGDRGIYSCLTLGSMFAEGKGTLQNYEQAKKYFAKVCEFGIQDGCEAYKKANEKSK